MGIAAARSSLA
jgi:hypothetical protein